MAEPGDRSLGQSRDQSGAGPDSGAAEDTTLRSTLAPEPAVDGEGYMEPAAALPSQSVDESDPVDAGATGAGANLQREAAPVAQAATVSTQPLGSDPAIPSARPQNVGARAGNTEQPLTREAAAQAAAGDSMQNPGIPADGVAAPGAQNARTSVLESRSSGAPESIQAPIPPELETPGAEEASDDSEINQAPLAPTATPLPGIEPEPNNASDESEEEVEETASAGPAEEGGPATEILDIPGDTVVPNTPDTPEPEGPAADPVAVDDQASVSEDENVLVDVVANDQSADSAGLTLTAAVVSSGAGTVTIVDNQISFTPDPGAQALGDGDVQDVVVRYEVQDSSGAVAQAVLNVSVQGDNDAPIVVGDSATVSENQALQVDVLGNDRDPEGGALSLTNATASAGSVSIVDGALLFEPGADFDVLANGETQVVNITYTAADSSGASSAGTLLVSVTGDNDAPLASADQASTSEDTAIAVDVLANDRDPEQGPLALQSAVVAQGAGTVTVTNGALSYDPGGAYQDLGAGETASVVVLYEIEDAQGASDVAELTLTIVGANDDPETAIDAAATAENAAVTVDVLVNDSDVDSTNLTLASVETVAGGGSVSIVNGAIVFDPGSDFDALAAGVSATVAIEYVVVDDDGGSATGQLDVTVDGLNDVPIAVADTGVTSEDAPVVVDVLANDTDAEGSALTLDSAVITSGGGSVSIIAGALRYDPGSTHQNLGIGDSAEIVIEYQVSDPEGATATAELRMTVNGFNDGPVAQHDTANAGENDVVSVDVLANDSDIDSVSLVLTSAAVTSGGGSVNIVGGEVVFDPGSDFDALAEGASATVAIVYQVEDQDGGAASGTLDITVDGTNDAPIAVDDVATVGEDDVASIDVVANDADAEGASLTLDSAAIISGSGTVSIVSGSVLYDPGSAYQHLGAGDSAEVVIAYQISDPGGAVATAELMLTVSGANDGPVVNGDTATTSENDSVSVDVLANDTDVDGASLTLASASVSSGGGSVSIVAGAVVFNPGNDFDALAAGASANVVVEYAVEDDQGAVASGTLEVTVNGVNDSPLAADDTASTTEDVAVDIDVVDNDTDPEGSPLTLDSASITSGSGSVAVVGGVIQYDPGSSYQGLLDGETAAVVIAYQVSDAGGATATAQLVLTLNGADDAPVAIADVAATTEDASVSVDVLDNDTDADSANLTLTSASVTSGAGSVSIVNGEVVFDPGSDFQALAAGASATVQVAYTVADDEGNQAAGSLAVEVAGVDDAAVLLMSNASVMENSANGTLVGNVAVTDPDSVGGHSFSLLDDAGGRFTIDASGNVRVGDSSKLDYESDASHEIHVQVVDQTNGATVILTQQIAIANEEYTIIGDNAVFDPLTVTLDIDVLGTLSAPSADPATLISAAMSDPLTGSVTIVDDRLLYDPGTDFNGLLAGQNTSVGITVTLELGDGTVVTNEVTVSVTGALGGLLLDAVSVGDVLVGHTEEDAIYGLAGDDALYGLGGDDQLFGGDDDDLLAGGAGADLLDGGSGTDTVSYAGANSAIVADLQSASVDGAAEAAGDTLVSIEGIQGTAFDDQLRGSDANNVLLGGAGNDVLIGGAGADYHDGGSGIDAAVIAGNLSDYAFARLADGSLSIGVDTFVAVEHFHFDDVTVDAVDLTDLLDTLAGVVGGAVVTTGATLATMLSTLDAAPIGDGPGTADSLASSPGDQIVHGGANSDSYAYALGHGDDYFHGGIGDQDEIDLSAVVAANPGNVNPFSIVLADGSTVAYDLNDGFVTLGQDASGTTTLDDGSMISFDGLEELGWV